MRTSTFTLPALLLMASGARAAEPVDTEFFEKKVRPILVDCQKCHNAQKLKGGLRLDSRAEMLKGGDSGPVVKPGDAASLLLRAINYDGDTKMPPKGKLPADEIAALTVWVKGGAPWPSTGASVGPAAATTDILGRAKTHWSFQSVKRAAVPELRDPRAAIRTPIDAFVLARLQAAGLTFAPEADRRTLIRRMYFDLIGLPPTPEEIEAFVRDTSPNAYEKVVEKLLASPHYGERWARHWLDLVRYAETYGHEFDFEIPEAWRYRDYVVRAFNADLPYNQFLTEHIAGDRLSNPRRNPKDESNESIIATGFWFLHEALHSPVDVRKDQADRVDNQIDVFGKATLGLTLACARCHDHKFDPVLQKDYYALFGVLASSRYQRAVIDNPAAVEKQLEELKAARAELDALLASGEQKPPAMPRTDGWRANATVLERFGEGWRQRWDAAGLALRPEAGDGFPHTGRESRRLQGALRSPTFTIDRRYLAVKVAGRDAKVRLILNGLQLIQNPIYGGLAQSINHGEDLRWLVFDLRMWKGHTAYLELLDEGTGFFAVTEAWFTNAPPPAEPGKVNAPPSAELPPVARSNAAAQKLAARVRELEAQIPTPHKALAMREGTPLNEHLFMRGNHKILGPEVPRAFLEVFGKTPFPGTGTGRLELAQAVTDPRNPLVARVMVNRIWQHHFGEGIVRSPDNFGLQGQPPTHPELLDWLAAEFVNPTWHAGGHVPGSWSIKHMHRLMVLSTAYRQSSRATTEQAAKAVTADPQNKLLHRQNLRRLEAEAIRDAMLAVSGRLDLAMGGPGVLPYLTEHQVGRGKPASGPLDGNGRRSLYLQVRRNFLNPMFTAFDYPTPFTAIGRRTVSNVPAQALAMLNNPFVLQQAELWSKRVLAAPNRTAPERIRSMYLSAFGRPPTTAEMELATRFVAEQSKEYGKPDHPKAWADLAHALLNAKEFIFIE